MIDTSELRVVLLQSFLLSAGTALLLRVKQPIPKIDGADRFQA